MIQIMYFLKSNLTRKIFLHLKIKEHRNVFIDFLVPFDFFLIHPTGCEIISVVIQFQLKFGILNCNWDFYESVLK